MIVAADAGPILHLHWIGCLSWGLHRMRARATAQALTGPLNFLQGDEQLKIDGQTFRGTGAVTEDNFDSAFYFAPTAAALPFAQWGGKVESAGNNSGKMSACRWHVLGAAIGFQRSLDLSPS